MKRVLLSLALVVLMVGIALAGCAKPAPSPAPTPAPEPTKTLDIGVAAPITGVAALLGENIQNAILLAIDDQNNQGGVTIAGQKYMLNGIVRDTKMDVVVSRNIAEELVFDKGVKAIAGPCIADSIGVQSITEKNKVIMFAMDAGAVPGLCGPNKPYSFFPGGYPTMCQVNGAAYIQKFYPQAKTVVTMVADIPDAPQWLDVAKSICQRYGLDWMGYEKVPMTTKDFMPIISRVLTKKPDIIDTSTIGGAMGGMCCLLIKQSRESGFDGFVWSPTVPPPGSMEEVVPEKYRTRIVTNDIVVDSPIVSQACRDMYQRYVKKFGSPPIDIAWEFYNGVKPFFEFLNGQDTMDTTAWMQGFEKYHWQGLFGHEGYWVGKPIFGINRLVLRNFWVSEWINGKLETKWEAPIPYELFVEQQ